MDVYIVFTEYVLRTYARLDMISKSATILSTYLHVISDVDIHCLNEGINNSNY